MAFANIYADHKKRNNHGLTVAQRVELWSTPEPMSGCVLWFGAFGKRGYGLMKVAGRMKAAHRVSFELSRGPIPEGMVLDHLCRTHSCINPQHLEPVTNLENHRRGFWANKTHCVRGHELTADNVYLREQGKTLGKRTRMCRVCRADASRRAVQKKRQP